MPAPRTGPPAIALAVAVTTVLLVTACSRPPDDQPLPAAPSGAACRSGDLATKTSRRLTVATGKPATSPWFESGNPSNGRGYESAVAYAVAAELGFSADDVDWIEVPSAGSDRPRREGLRPRRRPGGDHARTARVGRLLQCLLPRAAGDRDSGRPLDRRREDHRRPARGPTRRGPRQRRRRAPSPISSNHAPPPRSTPPATVPSGRWSAARSTAW